MLLSKRRESSTQCFIYHCPRSQDGKWTHTQKGWRTGEELGSSQFTQLLRKGEVTDPISPSVNKQETHVVMLRFQKVKNTFTIFSGHPHHTRNIKQWLWFL